MYIILDYFKNILYWKLIILYDIILFNTSLVNLVILCLGKINLAQLITAMPFMNKLVKVTISGKNLLEAFENSVRKYITLQGHGSFLQVSGK